MFTPLPPVDEFNDTNSEERIAAIREARSLLQGGGGMMEAFSGKGTFDHSDAIEVADYILTGHKYSDTHDMRDERDSLTDLGFGREQEEPPVTVHVIAFKADITGLDPEHADVVIDAAANAALKKHMKRDRKRQKKQAEQES